MLFIHYEFINQFVVVVSKKLYAVSTKLRHPGYWLSNTRTRAFHKYCFQFHLFGACTANSMFWNDSIDNLSFWCGPMFVCTFCRCATVTCMAGEHSTRGTRGVCEVGGGRESREKMWLWWRGSMSLLSAYALYIIHTEISFEILHSLYMIIFVLMFIELACWLWFRIKWSSASLHCTKLQWQSLCFCRCCCCCCCRHRHRHCHCRRRRRSLRRSCFILVDSFIRFSYTNKV